MGLWQRSIDYCRWTVFGVAEAASTDRTDNDFCWTAQEAQLLP